MTGICALVSRHPLTTEQQNDLKGFKVVQVAPPGRLELRTAWLDILITCGARPELMVLIFKSRWYTPLVHQIKERSPETRILYPLYVPPDVSPTGKYEWLGVWREFVIFEPDGTLRMLDWKPELMELGKHGA